MRALSIQGISGMKNEPYPIEWHDLKSSSTHAEMNAIVHRLRSKRMITGRRKQHSPRQNYSKFPNTLVVISIYKESLRNSRPCNECIRVMRMYGIKHVIYSTGNINEPFYMENVASMPFICQSRGNCSVNHS